jgi:hypothetical protein
MNILKRAKAFKADNSWNLAQSDNNNTAVL